MVVFDAEIERFNQNGEKTGWSYVFIPQAIANAIKPNEKKSFRVRGKIDNLEVLGLALVPMGEGNFILALKSALRKQLRKEEGAILKLSLEYDQNFKIEIPEDLELCLAQEETVLTQFLSMPQSHRNYYINWLNTAKTEPTRVKRISMIVNAMIHHFDFAQMLRAERNKKLNF